jgi:hypothetical protein
MAERISKALRDALLTEVQTLMADGVIRIYSGTQPANVETTESGDMLCEITLSDGAFTGGVATNGLEFDLGTGELTIASGETWSGTAAASGTAGWFRFYDNDYDTGADGSEEYIRFDGRVATSGAELNLNTTSLVSGGPVTISSFSFTIPIT